MLSVLILVPLLGAILIGLLPAARARSVALAIGLVTLVWSFVLLWKFEPSSATAQFQELLPWIDSLGLSYRLSLDGLSLPLVVLNSFLTLIAVYISDRDIQRPRFYYAMLLVLYVGVAGAFLADNLLLFFIFYELELIPLYLLIAIWGGARRGYAATKFLIYTALSGIFILGAFLGLTWLTSSADFNYTPVLGRTLPMVQQFVLLGAIVIGFGIKIPLVPLHTWLPDAHVEASTPISVLLAGVLLKLGTYGLVRFGLGLFPDAWAIAAPWLAWWAVVGAIYGSAVAIAQTDMKKMVAYSSIGHMGFILLACAAATPLSLLGTIFQMVSHGLISALLFIAVGMVYKKTGTRDLTILRGLLNPERGLPIIGALMIVGVMASAGMPGMVGFISEFIVFRGSFPSFPVQTLLCMVGTGLTAVYFLLLVNRAFFGRLKTQVAMTLDPETKVLPIITWGERLPGLILALTIVVFGLWPNWVLRWSETATSILRPAVTIAAVREASALPHLSPSQSPLP
jgi:NAD(P)H-quinone oxidoreductase subunit 4